MSAINLEGQQFAVLLQQPCHQIYNMFSCYVMKDVISSDRAYHSNTSQKQFRPLEHTVCSLKTVVYVKCKYSLLHVV